MTERPLIEVACGVLLRTTGEVLIAQRPAGKLAAGKWEFPGGKIEHDETAPRALARELHEELGIIVKKAEPLLRFRHDYSDRCVILDTWRVTDWEGSPHANEGQALSWLRPECLAALDALPTVAPTVKALRLPSHYAFTPPTAEAAFILARIDRIPRAALLRLRRPQLDDASYADLARTLLPACQAAGLGLMLDRAPALSVELGAAGWHATEKAMSALSHRPLPEEFCFAASVHTAEGLAKAQALGADCAVLGPVRFTATHADTAGIGWPGFEAMRGLSSVPVYAIGGLGPADVSEAKIHGAQGVAGISAYWV